MTEFYAWAKKNIDQLDDFIFTHLKTKYLYVFSLVYIFVVYRLGLIPGSASFIISQNPFINAFEGLSGAHYNYDSIIAPLIAYFTGLNSSLFVYSLFNLAIIILANVSLIHCSQRIWHPDIAKFLILLFILSPLSTILFTWIGSYDSVSYFVQVFLFFVSNPLLIFLLGFVGGANHFPIILVSSLSLLMFRLSNPEEEIGKVQLLSLLSGLILGLVALKLYQNYYELDLDVDRFSFVSKMIFQGIGLKSYVMRSLLSNWSTLLFSLYNVLWAIVVVLAYYLKRDHKPLFYVFLGSNTCCFALTLLVFDTTRIFCLLSWPMLFYGFIFMARRIQARNYDAYLSLRQYFVVVALVGLFIPRLYVWEGRIHFTAWVSSFFQGLSLG